jgi:hypothetical protein
MQGKSRFFELLYYLPQGNSNIFEIEVEPMNSPIINYLCILKLVMLLFMILDNFYYIY